MFDRILFPTDGSEGAAVAFDHAIDIAADHDATVYVLHVADTGLDSVTQIQGDVVDALELEGERIVAETADRAQNRAVDVETDVAQGDPYATILDYASASDIDLVVMPTHGRRGLERLLLGSTTERVIRRADVPVLTIRPDGATPTYPYRTVLVPTDGSDCAGVALDVGVEVARVAGAGLHLTSVVNVASLGADVRSALQVEQLETSAETILEQAAAEATEAGLEPTRSVVEFGNSIHRSILDYVDEHEVDLLVLGTHGRTGFDRYLLGSVTESVVRTASVPVLTVRSPKNES